MRKLIVTGDDLGATPGITRGILRAHQEGILTSCSVMTNLPGFQDSVKMTSSFPRIGIGVHLNLTFGSPVLPPAEVPALVREDGTFHPQPGLLFKSLLHFNSLLGRPEASAQVEKEFTAQIERLRATGITPTHLDGHKHIHLLPMVFPALLRVIRTTGIKKIRFPVEHRGLLRSLGMSPPRKDGMKKAFFLSLLALGKKGNLKREGIKTPDWFFGISWSGDWSPEIFLQCLRKLPEGVTELMVHPAVVDQDLMRTSFWLKEQRGREMEILISPEVKRVVEQERIELIHYGDLET